MDTCPKKSTGIRIKIVTAVMEMGTALIASD
jgi:hypothetical protein